MNRDQFLERDMNEAISKYKASRNNIIKAEEALFRGEWKEAKLAAVGLLDSLNELENLQRKKEEVEMAIFKLDMLQGRKRMVVIVHED